MAGEGIALAVVAALLSSLTESSLRGASLLGAGGAALAHAANRLAMGDVHAAAAWIPGARSGDLIHLYGMAFHSLLYVLAALTVLSALLVFGFLSRTAEYDDREDQERTKSQMSACN